MATYTTVIRSPLRGWGKVVDLQAEGWTPEEIESAYFHYEKTQTWEEAVPNAEARTILILRWRGMTSKIEAIKEIRKITNWGLKECKDFFESL